MLTARAAQCPPRGSWRTWLALGGRGAGKTRTGSEWVRFAVLYGGISRIALVAPTMHDAREVMIDGESGLRRICRAGEIMPDYEASRRRLIWPNGAQAQVFSAEDADSLRGPQFELAWCDEIAAWSDAEPVWDMLQMGLRLGERPRALLTTTPRRRPLIRKLMSDASVAVTRSKTVENSEHLSPAFLAHMQARYGGSRLGRQELDGELLDADEGALWTTAMLELARASAPPETFSEVIVAIDPPASVGPKADACGIIAAGAARSPERRDHVWVLADETVQGVTPLVWAQRAINLAVRVGAGQIVAEANQGGEMVRSVLQSAGCKLPIRLVHARLSKTERAAPVITLYEQGGVSHAGRFAELEEEMLSFGSIEPGHSPDRVDALVWAVTTITEQIGRRPRVRRL